MPTVSSSHPGARIIEPFDGLDDIRFGMTPHELEEQRGAPDAVRENRILKYTAERRGATEFFFRDGRLSEIAAYKPGRGKEIRERLAGASYEPIYIDGIEVLDKKGFQQLCARYRTVEGIGGVSVLFPELGLFVTGFRKRVPEGVYAIVFSPDRLKYFEVRLDV